MALGIIPPLPVGVPTLHGSPAIVEPLDAPYSFRAGVTSTEGVAAAGGVFGAVQVEGQEGVGQDGGTFGDIWFDRIHLIPSSRNVGFVLSALSFDQYVWNAFLGRSRILAEIRVDGPAGVSVNDPFGVPTHYAPSQIREYQVQVDEQGSARIDNLVVFDFIGIDEGLTTLILTGIRVVPFPFEANFREPIAERLGYLTDVLPAFDGTEQRVQLRDIPVRGIRYTVTTLTPPETGHLQALLFGWQDRAFGIPLWWDARPLGDDIDIGDTTITVETAVLDFEAGGLAMVWQDHLHWEVFTLEAVADGLLTATTEATREWAPQGVYVIPIRLGRLGTEVQLNELDLDVVEGVLDFDVEAFEVES